MFQFLLGETVIALFIGLIIAYLAYRSVYPDDKEVWTFDGAFGNALKTAGQIVLIVGAGGSCVLILQLIFL